MRILVLSPHPDDMEFGCGATISKKTGFGDQVRQIVFCLSEEMGIAPSIRKNEVMESARLLGLKGTKICKFPHRNFGVARQNILDTLISVRNEFEPHIVYTPATTDIHQDHRVVTEEAVRTFRETTILGYEDPWNNLSMLHCLFEIIREDDVIRKWKSIEKYGSVLGRRHYHTEAFIRSLATVRGAQVGTTYAEMFEVIRCVSR